MGWAEGEGREYCCDHDDLVGSAEGDADADGLGVALRPSRAPSLLQSELLSCETRDKVVVVSASELMTGESRMAIISARGAVVVSRITTRRGVAAPAARCRGTPR